MEFKVGERVKIKISGKIITLKAGHFTEGWWCCEENSLGWSEKEITKIEESMNNFRINFIKIGDPMSKYDELSSRIDALDDGWNKEADDITTEINNNSKTKYVIWIPFYSDGAINIYNWVRGTTLQGREESKFSYKTQCEKMEAFKKALHRLLDHSDIKKDEKADKIKELQNKLGDITKQAENLIKQIKELK